MTELDDFQRDMLAELLDDVDVEEFGLWELAWMCEHREPPIPGAERLERVLPVVERALTNHDVLVGVVAVHPIVGDRMLLAGSIRHALASDDAEYTGQVWLIKKAEPSAIEVTDEERAILAAFESSFAQVHLGELLRAALAVFATRALAVGATERVALRLIESDAATPSYNYFEPWRVDTEAALARIREEWTALGRDPAHAGEIAVFTTKARHARIGGFFTKLWLAPLVEELRAVIAEGASFLNVADLIHERLLEDSRYVRGPMAALRMALRCDLRDFIELLACEIFGDGGCSLAEAEERFRVLARHRS